MLNCESKYKMQVSPWLKSSETRWCIFYICVGLGIALANTVAGQTFSKMLILYCTVHILCRWISHPFFPVLLRTIKTYQGVSKDFRPWLYIHCKWGQSQVIYHGWTGIYIDFSIVLLTLTKQIPNMHTEETYFFLWVPTMPGLWRHM